VISIVKPTRCTSVSNLFYFGMTLHVSDDLSIHRQEFKAVHTATGLCQTDNAVHFASGYKMELQFHLIPASQQIEVSV